jgi:hypothetical protein
VSEWHLETKDTYLRLDQSIGTLNR